MKPSKNTFASLHIMPNLKIQTFLRGAPGTHAQALTLNKWTFVHATFAYMKPANGSPAQSACYLTIDSNTQLLSFRSAAMPASTFSPPDKIILGANSASSFQGEIRNLDIYNPGGLVRPCTLDFNLFFFFIFSSLM